MKKITEKDIKYLIKWFCKTRNIPVYGEFIPEKHKMELEMFLDKQMKRLYDVEQMKIDITGFPIKERQ